MKIIVKAGPIAAALALGTSAIRANKSGPVRLVADGDMLSVTCADAHSSFITNLAATVVEPGECIVPADRLAALAAGFPAGAQISISSDCSGASIANGNSLYKLPIIPADDLPAALAIDTATAEIEIGGEDLLYLLDPLFAASQEKHRFNICGLFLHSVGDQLVAAATDGMRLCKVSVPADTFSVCRDLTIPSKPAAMLRKIILQIKPKLVTLRRSRTLISFSAASFAYTSRLIDGAYPQYENVIPAASPNAVGCDRAELVAALSRLAAVANSEPPPLIALCWSEAGSLCLSLARQPGDGIDTIAADGKGSARFAVTLAGLSGMLAEFSGPRIRFEAGTGPMAIQGGDKLAWLVTSAWNFSDP
jgi:DNA polymerase III sliding clamp (beta) subunit (PCNA family)